MFVLIAQAALWAGDVWPTLHNDYQRSGYTDEVVEGPYERKWFRDFHGEMIASRVEAIVAEGRCFVGTFAGNMYAIDVTDGSTRWGFKAAGPIGYSPCYEKGRVYFGADEGFDRGSLYCLRASDGTLLWKCRTEAGIWTSPACDGERVYVGDRGGTFYAIGALSSEIVWTYKTGYMILTPASFSEDMTKIIFASEDMHVYCLDRGGKLLWKSKKLAGLSLRDHGPTIWKELAIIRTNPADGFHTVMGLDGQMLKKTQEQVPVGADDEILFDKWGDLLMKETPARRKAEKEAVVEYLRQKPEYHTLHALGLEDGEREWISQVLFTTGLHNPPTPPAFNPHTGRLFTFYRTAMTNYQRGIRRYSAIGEVNRRTGLIDMSWPETIHPDKDFYGFPMIGDETQALSIMGDVLISNHQGELCGVDLRTMKMHPIWRGRDTYGGIFGPGAVEGTFEGAERLAGQGYLTGMPNEWHGPDRSIVAIAAGRMFWVVGSQVVCLAGPGIAATESGGTKPPPPIRNKLDLVIGGNMTDGAGRFDETVAGVELSSQDVRLVVDDIAPAKVRHVRSAEADEIRGRLEDEVTELIADGPWAPLVVELGIVRQEECFRRTGETMQILALSLPHLSEEVRGRAVEYIKGMLHEGMPLQKASWSYEGGKRRAYYDYGPGMRDFTRRKVEYGADVEDIYALWACGHYAGLWDEVLSQCDGIEAVYREYAEKSFEFDSDDDRNDAAEHLNEQIAGVVGYVRIMERAGQGAKAEQAMSRLRRMLAERIDHELADSRLVRYTDRYQMGNYRHNSKVPRYVGLVPEMGAVLRRFAGGKLRRYVEGLDEQLPVWYQAWGERMIGGENYISPPHLARGLFAAMADGLEAPVEVLAGRLDQPWCQADLYYIEKTSAILRRIDTDE